MSLAKGKNTMLDFAWNALYTNQPKVLHNIFNLCVKANMNNYVFSYTLYNKCFYKQYDPNILDVRSHKLFRKSLAKFIKKGKV